MRRVAWVIVLLKKAGAKGVVTAVLFSGALLAAKAGAMSRCDNFLHTVSTHPIEPAETARLRAAPSWNMPPEKTKLLEELGKAGQVTDPTGLTVERFHLTSASNHLSVEVIDHFLQAKLTRAIPHPVLDTDSEYHVYVHFMNEDSFRPTFEENPARPQSASIETWRTIEHSALNALPHSHFATNAAHNEAFLLTRVRRTAKLHPVASAEAEPTGPVIPWPLSPMHFSQGDFGLTSVLALPAADRPDIKITSAFWRALTGFAAAKVRAGSRRLIVHSHISRDEPTGISQIIAATLAEVDELEIFAASDDEYGRLENAQTWLGQKKQDLNSWLEAAGKTN